MANKKIKKSIIALTAIILAAVVAFTIFAVWITFKNADISQYTVNVDDGYYSETTYYLNESAYNRYEESKYDAAENIIKRSLTNGETDYRIAEGEYVMAAVKNVWVGEQTDEEGAVSESRLLNKSEVEELEKLEENYSDTSLSALSKSLLTSDYIGEDSESFYKLSIEMIVYYDTSTKEYAIKGTASWEKQLVWWWQSETSAEESHLDYIGISWGGNGALVAKSQSASGTYYNGNAVSVARKTSSSYAGYVWQFNEKSGYLGKELKLLTVKSNIKSDSNNNAETNARLTYIHTYHEIKSEVKIEVNTSPEIAASVTLSEEVNSWQIEIDVAGITY